MVGISQGACGAGLLSPSPNSPPHPSSRSRLAASAAEPHPDGAALQHLLSGSENTLILT